MDPSTLSDAASATIFKQISVKASGIIYLAGQKLIIGNGANFELKPGSIVADYILPQGGNLDLTGSLATKTAAEVAMRKPMEDGVVLVH